jgi:triosephosphate isomerase
MNRKIIAANWKMHLTLPEARRLVAELMGARAEAESAVPPMILCVPYPHLLPIGHQIDQQEDVYLAAQNVHHQEYGAYTGEVSAEMLASIEVAYVVIGHSERRQYHQEDEPVLREKVQRTLTHEMKPIYCIGESLAQRQAGETDQVLAQQLRQGLFHLEAAAFQEVIIAYEPIWAIGTGENATPEQAQAAHRTVRAAIREHYGEEIAEQCSILYGGSVKAENATQLFEQPDVDGGLVGGASLDAHTFFSISQQLGIA